MSCFGWCVGTAVDTSAANRGLAPKVAGALDAVDGLKRLPTELSTRAGVSLDLVGYSKNSLGNSSKNHPKVAESLEAMQQAGLPTHINVSWCEPAELVKDVHELRWAGQGSQGVVYEGIWQGALVAVKWSLAEQLDTGACELLFSRLLGHPNVVQTYDAKVAILDNQIFEQDISSSSSSSVLRSAGSSSGTGGRNASQTTPTIMESQDLVDARSESYKSEEGFGNPFGRNSGLTDVRDMLRLMGAKPGQCITQMIMEYCDQGSLLTAISRGIFLPTSRFGQKVALRALFRTAREISQGMTHLHQAHVVHGDLKPANVLLMNSRKDRRGFIAKISDFGLAQYCPASRGVVENAPWGTLVFMAPERFSTNRLEPASDVWSFGVLMWQMYTARMPYEGTTQNKLLHGISNGTLHLTWPSGSPTSLVTLVASCMARQPSARPSFEQLIHQLATLESDVRMEGFRLSNSIDNPRQSSSHERPGNLADSNLQKKSSGLHRKHSTKNAPSAQLEIECPIPVPAPSAVDAAQQWTQNPVRTTPGGAASSSPRAHQASTAVTAVVIPPQMPRIATGTTAAQRQQAALAVLQCHSSQPGTPPQQAPPASNNSSSNNTGGGASSQPSQQYRAAHPTTSALMSASTSANTCEGSLGSMAWSAATGTVGNSSPGRNNSTLGPAQGNMWTGSAINERLSMDRRSQSRSMDMDAGLSAGGAALISPDPDFTASRFAVADAAQEAVGSWSSATPVPCPTGQHIGGWTTSTQAKRAQAMSRLRHTSEEWEARKP